MNGNEMKPKTQHKVGQRVCHKWLGETGVVVQSWRAAFRVKLDGSGLIQQWDHDRWTAE